MIKSLLLTAVLFPMSAFALFDAEKAISQALSEKLVYLGSYIPTWSASGTIPSCLYKNSKVLVLSNYCLKRDIPAASIRIHSKNYNEGHVNIYAEGTAGGDASEQVRSDYFDPLWRLSSDPNDNGFRFDLTPSEYRKYEEVESSSPLRGCLTSDHFQDSLCAVGYESELDSWGKASIEFRKSPSKNWYLLLKTLKNSIPSQL
jgi:hypothetical protein